MSIFPWRIFMRLITSRAKLRHNTYTIVQEDDNFLEGKSNQQDAAFGI